MFGINSIRRQLFKLWRSKRFDLFLQLMGPSSSDILLDVGGLPYFWTSHAQPVQRIDTLNLHEVPWSHKDAPDHEIQSLVGDGCALPMAPQTYDIGFSNSVIEHVGSWERQCRFASEIRRVAKALWVQTPAYECPIEPHYLTPLIHYLPSAIQKRLLRWCTVWGLIERPSREQIDFMVDTTRLLRKSEMRRLFPDCEIITERLLWVIPKSYIAIRRKEEPSYDVLRSDSQTADPARGRQRPWQWIEAWGRHTTGVRPVGPVAHARGGTRATQPSRLATTR